ncbi:TetR/AcrR family transcriptional regulator [Streptomyces bryophytorum]|uniref:TetR family transcriptional regulator n=1 Tax=Actinacidiphila bryophytorum TaxID=1436133 RepID=A0A9W4H3S5_9ACTN|nr:ScbR family autoregulator-binding transcription factor [Actinacidiphila bryophytorum]MBM9435929.1 TetR/AcrR family transcriptional regulator [Actinacidiphila bryophytorum]MBN6541508.1 TetR/AcrR family transcriptional regulator [Actinacidiphila bryophytorum]CAG7649508.1 TetR family transcriptional regulator [Actinacidiphila bryophytorum]
MQGRAKTTRRFLLEAAAELFDERGYAGTSISDIGARSGRTSGSIYFHYASKEKLALAVVDEHFATWPEMIGRHQAVGVPALERLVALSFTVARAFRDDVVVRAGARLWMERKAIDAALPTPFVGWIETVAGLLEEARGEGALAAGIAPDAAAHSIVCAFFGLHTVSDALDGRRCIEEHLYGLWSLLLAALQAEPDPASLLARVMAGTGSSDAGRTALAALPARQGGGDFGGGEPERS